MNKLSHSVLWIVTVLVTACNIKPKPVREPMPIRQLLPDESVFYAACRLSYHKKLHDNSCSHHENGEAWSYLREKWPFFGNGHHLMLSKPN